MTKLIIEIDDDDRDDVPDKPWTANVRSEHGTALNDAAGVGATPEDAVRDLFGSAHTDHEPWASIS